MHLAGEEGAAHCGGFHESWVVSKSSCCTWFLGDILALVAERASSVRARKGEKARATEAQRETQAQGETEIQQDTRARKHTRTHTHTHTPGVQTGGYWRVAPVRSPGQFPANSVAGER